MNLATVEMKAFVPALDMDRSLDFYRALGFDTPWTSPDLAHVRYGGTGFLLQAYPQPEFVRHFMMHLRVASVDDWHASVVASGVTKTFGARLDAPADRPWGMRDFTLTDPSGVLWRIAQHIDRGD